ncbi:hypothetical protein AALB53_08250 [Lachnospiraceae bacterium 47-T17]
MTEKDKSRYMVGKAKELLVLEQEDFSEQEWDTVLKIFSMKKADRIVLSDYTFEVFGVPKKEGLVGLLIGDAL